MIEMNIGQDINPKWSDISLEIADEAALSDIGDRLTNVLLAGDVLALSGELGAGKTSLARTIVRKFLVNPDLEVPSPTFSLVQQYQNPKSAIGEIWHVDFYRLVSPLELWELGLEEAFGHHLLIIEWAERFADHLPENTLWIILEAGKDTNSRKITFRGENWNGRLKGTGIHSL